MPAQERVETSFEDHRAISSLGSGFCLLYSSILSASFVLCRRIRIRLYRRFQRLKFLSGGMRRSSPTACRPRPPGTRRLSRGKATRPMPCSTRCSAVAYNAHWIHVHVVATQLAGCASCMTAWSWTACVSRAAYCAAYSPCDRASLATLKRPCARPYCGLVMTFGVRSTCLARGHAHGSRSACRSRGTTVADMHKNCNKNCYETCTCTNVAAGAALACARGTRRGPGHDRRDREARRKAVRRE